MLVKTIFFFSSDNLVGIALTRLPCQRLQWKTQLRRQCHFYLSGCWLNCFSFFLWKERKKEEERLSVPSSYSTADRGSGLCVVLPPLRSQGWGNGLPLSNTTTLPLCNIDNNRLHFSGFIKFSMPSVKNANSLPHFFQISIQGFSESSNVLLDNSEFNRRATTSIFACILPTKYKICVLFFVFFLSVGVIFSVSPRRRVP